MRDKLVIGIKGTSFPPYKEKWEECMDTWGGLFQDRGYTVRVHLGNPDLEEDYKVDGDIFWSKVDEQKENQFLRSIYNPYKWFLNETDFEYFFISDPDTFVHPDRLVDAIQDKINRYGNDLNYLGCCLPWRGWAFGSNTEQWIPIGFNYNYDGEPFRLHMASGGPGFLVSRKAAQIVVDHFNPNDFHYMRDGLYYDDEVAATVLAYWGMRLLHDSRFMHVSPFRNWDISNSGNVPLISKENEIIAQHYVGCGFEGGEMSKIMNDLGLERSLEGKIKSLVNQDITDQELGNKIRYLIWNKN